jgi:hypothetical protein
MKTMYAFLVSSMHTKYKVLKVKIINRNSGHSSYIGISLKYDILEFHVFYPFLYEINIPQSHSTNIKKFYYYIQIDTCLYDT